MNEQLALEWVPAGEHTKEDLDLIEQANEAQPTINRISRLKVDHDLRLGKKQLFRIKPGPGVILTEIIHDHGVKRLSLVRGAGRAAHQIRSIFSLLDTYRQEMGCECIETVVYSDRLKRALVLSGAKVEGTILIFPAEEPSDGQ
jgi:hypothetical protein